MGETPWKFDSSRPHHSLRGSRAAPLPPSPASVLRGIIQEIVYLGTDTHFHIRLEDDTALTVRQQNARSGSCGFTKDEAVGISLSDDVAQILRD